MKKKAIFFAVNKTKIAILIIPFFSLFICLFSGCFASATRIEKIAEYAANIVDTCVPTKDLLSISVEPTSGDSLPNSEDQFHQLYGVFKQKKITFASGYNMTKEEEVKIESINADVNFSVAYIGETLGSKKYNGHYIHPTYPVELMFPLDSEYMSVKKVIVSESQARKILQNVFEIYKEDDQYTIDDYKKIIKIYIPISINGTSYDFLIYDVYYENTYYSKSIFNCSGDFVYTSFYFPKVIKKQNLYFLNDKKYENTYFMEYINRVYDSSNYSFKCVKQNISKTFDEKYVLSFTQKPSNNRSWLYISLIVLCSLLTLSFAILSFRNIKLFTIKTVFLSIVLLFIPYFFAYFLYLINGSLLFFSSVGTKLFALFYILNFIVVIISCYLKYYRKSYFKHIEENTDELYI